MSDTPKQVLARLRDIQQRRFELEQDEAQRRRKTMETKAELAAPLIAAFREVENEFASIRMMKQVWPEDFSKKPDRVKVFLAGLIGPGEAPHGIQLHIANGTLRFEATTFANRPPDLVSTKEVWGHKSVMIEFPNHDKWYEYFLRVLSEMVEL